MPERAGRSGRRVRVRTGSVTVRVPVDSNYLESRRRPSALPKYVGGNLGLPTSYTCGSGASGVLHLWEWGEQERNYMYDSCPAYSTDQTSLPTVRSPPFTPPLVNFIPPLVSGDLSLSVHCGRNSVATLPSSVGPSLPPSSLSLPFTTFRTVSSLLRQRGRPHMRTSRS